ncbi:MAG: hypothetical protein DMD84_11240, partial [Candidatus Rokuibacteriota bacterium]
MLPLVAVPETADASATRLLQYLPAGAPVIVDAPRLLDETSEDAPGRRPLAEIIAGRPRVELEVLAAGEADVTLETLSVDPYSGKFDRLVDDANRWRAEGFTVRLVAADPGQAEHLREILHDHDLDTRVADALESPDSIAIVVGELSGGFAVPAVGLVVLAETEIFGARRRMLRRPKYQRGAALTAFTDLAVNDLVVHEDHGIGQYLGLRTMHIGDKDADFLLLEYADGNQLYVP